MSAVLQIVDGHAGSLVLELNGWLGGVGGFAKKGMNLTEGQLSGNAEASWSPLAGPSALGRRRVTIPFLLIGSSADDVGAKVTKLMLATQGPWWLRVRRHEASADSWLQCFGCVPFVESQITASRTAHIAQGTITCETAPYALGARVDGSAAIGQNPTSSAWGLDINGVTGDTATPLLIRMNDNSVFGVGALGAFISVRRRQTPSALTAPALTCQAENSANSVSGGTGITMSTLTGDSDLSGSSGRRATFSSGYLAMASASITFAAPTLTGVDVPGVYRVFVRIRRNTTANTQQLVLKAFNNSALITPEDITVPAGGAATRLVDLGLVQWPAAAPASIASPVPSPSGATPTRITLQFWRKSAGAAIVDFDFMCWIPADDDAGYLTTDMALPNASTRFVCVDGYQNIGMITDGDPTGPHNIVGQSYGSTVPTVDWTGGVPRVRPGSNRVFVVAGLGGVYAYPIASNINFAYSYWPRYTWLR